MIVIQILPSGSYSKYTFDFREMSYTVAVYFENQWKGLLMEKVCLCLTFKISLCFISNMFAIYDTFARELLKCIELC